MTHPSAVTFAFRKYQADSQNSRTVPLPYTTWKMKNFR